MITNILIVNNYRDIEEDKTAGKNTLAVLLGASPGASTAVSIMVELVSKCFPEQFSSPEWQEKLKMMIPSFGQMLNNNPILLDEIRKNTGEILKLNN